MSRELLAEEAQQKLEPTALSCFLNTAACNLKMELWQEALDSCNEVRLLEGGGGGEATLTQWHIIGYTLLVVYVIPRICISYL